MRERPLPLLLLLFTTSVMGGVGPTWRRETPIYSTLPDPNNNFQAQQPNVNFYQVDQGPPQQQPPFQGPGPQQQQQFLGPLPQQQDQPFVFQGPQQDQQQFQFQQDSFLPIQDSFDGSNNQLEESGGSTLSGLMNSLLEGTGIGGVLDRMSEMWENLTGGVFGGMSRVMMGMLALPFMIPMAAVPLGVGAMALMAFPILQLTLPGIRRSFREGAVLSHSVLVSEECMERLSCNLAKKFPYDSFFSRFGESENRWLNRVSKSVKAARTGDCRQFTCSPVTKMQNIVRSFLLGESPPIHTPSNSSHTPSNNTST